MAWNPNPTQLGRLKAALFIVALWPFFRLAYGIYENDLGANPVEFVQRYTGTWTFNFLLLTLTISPLRVLTGAHWILRLRRMLGLFTFFYGCVHFLSFIGFDHYFDVEEIARDVLKRPFVTVGFAALAIMLPLALTSNQFSIRRLGGRRWQELHRSVYLVAILATLHYFWLVKIVAILWPVWYAILVAILLGWRARERIRKFTIAAPSAPVTEAVRPMQFYPRKPD